MANPDTGVSSGPDRHDVPAGGRSGFVIVDGRQVHYLEWGRGDRPPVLALHGGGQTAYMYEELGAALCADYHVLAPDLPHHGDSEPLRPGAPLTRHELAASLPALLAEFGLERVAVVGASLGGITALTLAADRPELVASIVLVDVGHQLEEEGVRRIIDFMRRHESFASLTEAAAAVAEYLPHRREVRPQSLRRNLRQRADGRWVWKHGLATMPESVTEPQEWRSLLAGLDEDAQRIKVPVLLLRGAQSDVLSAQGAADVTRLIPDARLAEVSAAGHLAAGDNPGSTVSLVRGFLADTGW